MQAFTDINDDETWTPVVMCPWCIIWIYVGAHVQVQFVWSACIYLADVHTDLYGHGHVIEMDIPWTIVHVQICLVLYRIDIFIHNAG